MEKKHSRRIFSMLLLASLTICMFLVPLVTATFNFNSITPSSQYAKSGGSATYTLSFGGNYGNNIALSVSSTQLTGATYNFNPNPATKSTGSILTLQTSLSQPTGTFTFTVQAVGESTRTQTATLIIENSAPTSSASVLTSYKTSRSFPISFSSSDTGGSGVANVHLWYKAGSSPWVDGGVWTSGATFTSATDGIYQFYTIATDNVGNVEASPSSPDTSTTVDLAAPSSSLLTALPVYEKVVPFNVAWSASDATSGVASATLYYRAGTSGVYTNFGTSTSSPFSFTVADQGTYQFYVVATDYAGNSQTAPTSGTAAETSTLIDSIVPISSASALPSFEASRTFNIIYTSSDTGGSGVASVQLYYRAGTSGSYDAGGTSSSGSISFTSSADGLYQFYTIATDSAGNVEATPASPDTFTTIDSANPTVDISSPSAGFVHVVAVPVSGTASASSGIVSVQWQVDSTAGSWTTAAGTTIWSFTTGTLGQGAHTIYVKATDNFGKTQTTSVAITVQSIFTISITQTPNGLVTGPNSVDWGTDAIYTIAASDGYSIVDVVVDGTTHLGATTSATISNVKEAGHSITASYALTIHSTVLTISVDPKIVNKYDSPHATVSGYLKSEGIGINDYPVIISYNDGRNGWIVIDPLHPAITGAESKLGYFTKDFPVTPDFTNGFIAFRAEFAGDAGDGYAAAQPVYTGAVGEESGNLNVLPEYLFGGLAALGACLVGFAIFKKRSSLPSFRR